MHNLSYLIDYRHTNMYVRKMKILASIHAMQNLLRKQFADKVIIIPNYILRDEIEKAQTALRHTNQEIADFEQQSFRFGGQY